MNFFISFKYCVIVALTRNRRGGVVFGNELVECVFDGFAEEFVMQNIGGNMAGRHVADLRSGPQLAQIGTSFTRYIGVVAGRHDDDTRAVHWPSVVGDVSEFIHDATHEFHRLVAGLSFLQSINFLLPETNQTKSIDWNSK